MQHSFDAAPARIAEVCLCALFVHPTHESMQIPTSRKTPELFKMNKRRFWLARRRNPPLKLLQKLDHPLAISLGSGNAIRIPDIEIGASNHIMVPFYNIVAPCRCKGWSVARGRIYCHGRSIHDDDFWSILAYRTQHRVDTALILFLRLRK